MQLILLFSTIFMCAGGEPTLPLPMCERDACNCPLPNTTPGDLKHVSDGSPTGCLCQCGREMGEACDVTDHCAQGSECIAPSDFSNVGDRSMGICTDKCKRHKCSQFYECKVVGGEVKCVCETFKCRRDINIPVSVQRQTPSGTIETTTFINSCYMVNENCHMHNNNPFANLWQRRALVLDADHDHDGSGALID